jgi:aspartate/methionine/tyrosine aminotransferase
VLTFTGAQEPLFWLIAELLSDGGHAVVTVPNYQSIESIPLAGPRRRPPGRSRLLSRLSR